MTRVPAAAFAAVVLAAAAACSGSPNAPDGAFDAEVTLRPGQATVVASTPLTITFDRVASDSRCPASALCITSGDALAVFRVGVDGRGAAEINLRTVGGTTGEDLTAAVAGYELRIAGLQPYPMTTTPIPQGDYRVTLRVSRD